MQIQFFGLLWTLYLYNATEEKKTLDMTNQMKKRGLSSKKIKHVNFHPQGYLLVRANTNDGNKHLKYRVTSAWKLAPFSKK